MRYEICLLALSFNNISVANNRTEPEYNCDVTFSVCVCVAIEDLSYDRSQLMGNVFEPEPQPPHILVHHHTFEGASFT